MDKLSPNDSVFNTVIDQYNKVVVDFSSSLIRKNLTEEFKTKGDYVGREIYELLQNAEDQKSEYVRITLNDDTISVENGGPKCVPFSREGFISIMMADMSPKFEDGSKKFIGCKGLGFRSILNWAKSIEIRSNGVSCKFSREIADKCWDGIKQHILENVKSPEIAAHVIAEHESYAQKYYGFKTPVPTLAKPQTAEYLDGNNSTIISVEYDKADSRVVESINDQIKSISGAILIFLTHIKRIEIQDNVRGTTQILTSSVKNYDEEIRQYDIITERQASVTYFVLKNQGAIFDKKYEVSIAYCPETQENRHYLYSFFPTKMYIGLPCLVHATFDLNSSRKALKENSKENDRLMEILAENLMKMSRWVAKNRAKQSLFDWDALSIITLNEFDKKDFPIIDKCINEQFPNLPIIPTIGNKYLSFNEIEYYGKAFSIFLDDISVVLPETRSLFGRHVRSEIPSMLEIPASVDYDSFEQRINLLSEKLLSIGDSELDLRIQLIDALLNLNCGKKFKVLLERETHKLCEDTAYIYVGRSLPFPPKELKYTFIDRGLLEKIYCLLGSQDPETVRKKLVQITDIRRSDVNTLKEKIVSFTETNTDIVQYEKLIHSLFWGSYKVEESDKITNVVKEIADDLKLFDSTGVSRHSPCEMVLRDECNEFDDYPAEWVLYHSLEEWVRLLDSNLETVKEFFFDVLGVSQIVPREQVSFGNDCDYLLQYSAKYAASGPPWPPYFTTDKINSHVANKRLSNCAFIVKPDFLDYLLKKGTLCDEALDVIFSDPQCRVAASSRVIYCHYNTFSSEIASCSYLEFKLKDHQLMDPLKTYVVSDNISLLSANQYAFKVLTGFSEQETKQILLNLGAKSSLADLTKGELYSILYQIPDSRPPKGVSDVYKKIREALLPYRDKCLIEAKKFCETGKVYARYQGCVKKFAANEVYYWDNDQLPKKVLSTRPKFEIGNRVGEESVRDLFGISLAKDIQIEEVTDESCLNEMLTTHVNSYFKRRIKYLLSYCYKGQNRFREDYVEPLKDVQFRIFSSYKYKLDDSIEELKEGEMLTSPNQNRVFNICSTVGDITNDCLEDPDLCEAIVESICISLKITGSELVGVFRNIISNTISKNEYLWSKDIEPDTWALIEKTMGVSEKETQFWTIVSEQTRRPIDISLLSIGYREKMDYLKSVFQEVGFESIFEKRFPEFDDLDIGKKYFLVMGLSTYGFRDVSMIGEDALRQFYASRLYEIKNTYGKAYETFRYRNLMEKQRRSIEEVYAFYDECKHFLEDHSWTDDLAQENHLQLLSELQLESLVSDYMKKHGVADRDDVDDIKPRPAYRTIMSDAGLIESDFIQRDLTLSYFDGFEENFREIVDDIVQQRNADTRSANSEDSRTAEASSFSYGYGVPVEYHTQKSQHPGTDGGSYNSRPANLYRNGKNAEWLVYNALCARKDEFPKVIPNSRILNSVIGSDNNEKHCDILYYKKDKPSEERYLEVKSLKGSSIFLSDDEYLFATEHKETYDIAVVKDNSVVIIEHPFMDEEEKPALRVRPDVYRIDLKVESAR